MWGERLLSAVRTATGMWGREKRNKGSGTPQGLGDSGGCMGAISDHWFLREKEKEKEKENLFRERESKGKERKKEREKEGKRERGMRERKRQTERILISIRIFCRITLETVLGTTKRRYDFTQCNL